MESKSAFRHYKKAPIVEAVLSFDFDEIPADRFSAVEAVQSRLAAAYPLSRALKAGEISLSSLSGTDGIALASEDGKYVVQLRRDGFAFSRLAPYERWETFITEARKVWNIFSEIVSKSDKVNILSIRYINEFRLPYGVPLHIFFNVYPAVPNRDTLFSDFFLSAQTAIPDVPEGMHTVFFVPSPSSGHMPTTAPDMTIATETQTSGNKTSLEFAPQQLEATAAPTFGLVIDNIFHFNVRDSNNAWSFMDRARAIKNDTFESQITDRMREMLA